MAATLVAQPASAGWVVTSSTGWPISQTRRPSLRLSRYSAPRRVGISDSSFRSAVPSAARPSREDPSRARRGTGRPPAPATQVRTMVIRGEAEKGDDSPCLHLVPDHLVGRLRDVLIMVLWCMRHVLVVAHGCPARRGWEVMDGSRPAPVV